MDDDAQPLGKAKTMLSNPPIRPNASEGEEPADDGPPDLRGYEIRKELGRGGMGVVYEALQTDLGRLVAIKMILNSSASTEEKSRFVKEGEAVARFHHPNIVQIFEIGEHAGRPYFSLEYVDGGNLEERLEEKPLPWREACQLLSTVSQAMQAAHARGIVHRDLKPANILLSKDGAPKIADFGIAKRLDAADQTQVGRILGTPNYMSPEQAKGRTDLVGPASDIYGLGAILYDCITGRPPFEADNTMTTLLQAIAKEPVEPILLQPHIPRDLNIIVLKCLEKAPDKRYSSARELAEDLDRLLAGEPILARPISAAERIKRWMKTHPAWATLIVVSSLAVVFLAITGAWFTRELQKELRATEAARKEAASAREEIRMTLVRSTADAINADLRQLAGLPRTLAAALETRSDWAEGQLDQWIRSAIRENPNVFGMAVAFEAGQITAETADFCLYGFRGEGGIETKQLLPPEYTPLYREWAWYTGVDEHGAWSEPYVDEGGGEVPMVTYSMPFHRAGKKAGVVTVDLSLSYFKALDETIRISDAGDAAFTFVVTDGGTVVSHPEAMERFPARASLGTFESDVNLWRWFKKEPHGRTVGTDPTSGQPAELLHARVNSANWTCVTIIPRTDEP